MAEKSVVWSPRAYQELMQILDYFNRRNGSTTYSEKLLNQIDKMLETLAGNEWIGKRTKKKNLRVLIMKEYAIFYSVEKHLIKIHSFWDNRQNPKKRVV